MLMKASPGSLRMQNRGIVLSALRRLGAVSHTEISEWSGLSSATISAITTELEKEHILQRVEQAPASGRGRPRVKLQQNPDAAYIATIRITSETIQYSLVDYSGILKDRFEEKRPPEEKDVDAFCARFKAGLERLANRSKLDHARILTISIATKGLVTRGKPELSWSPVFENQTIDFEALLSKDWPGQIRLTNDTQFAAQAIMRKNLANPSNQEKSQIAVLSLNHSIGLGIATQEPDGRITAFAPPFGHMMHINDGPICRCGSHGCIEAFAGYYGILRTAFEVDKNIIPAKFIPSTEIEKIAMRARQGDRMSEYAFRMAGEAIGIGIGRLLTLLGPMPIAITGAGISYYDLIQDAILNGVRNNLQIRRERMPDISLYPDESELIFYGNAQGCLSDLDNNIIADRTALYWKQT